MAACCLTCLVLLSSAPLRIPKWIEELRPKGSLTPELRRQIGDPLSGGIKTKEAWKVKRASILKHWCDFLGRCPRPKKPRARVFERVELPGGITRTKLALEVESQIWMPCYLFAPQGKGPFPACLCLHSTTDETIRQPAGLGAQPEKAFALDLAKRGYVTIAPENFLWYYPVPPRLRKKLGRWRGAVAAFQERHPGVRGMAKMIADASTALDYLLGLKQVDQRRIGAIGHSLGGKEVTFLMAFDQRVRCGVSSEGGVAFSFSNYADPWYLGSEIRKHPELYRCTDILALIAPRAWLLIGGNSADGTKSRPYVQVVLPLWDLLENPAGCGLFVHNRGHAVPPEARKTAFKWLDYHLKQ